MNSQNKCIFTGRLTKNPREGLRRFENGDVVLNFSIATSSLELDKDGNTYQRTSFANCTVWGERAEKMAFEFKKGDPVEVKAQFTTRNYEAKDGSQRQAVEFRAYEVTAAQKAVVKTKKSKEAA